MKKRIFSIIIPIILVLVISLGVIIPTSLADREEERPINYDVENQQVYAAGDDTYVSQTGAATASKSYKGGAIFLEPGAVFNFKGGEISGSSNTYGGAIYISKGATFTMESGMITNCKATYGGAIYVESGATCTITGGTITGCKANYGAAIYVEKGANFSVSAEANIVDNEIENENFSIQVSEDTIDVGFALADISVSQKFFIQYHYVELGSFPQTFVGSELQGQLENLYLGGEFEQIDEIVSHRYEYSLDEMNDSKWQRVIYNGEVYVRCESQPYDESYKYKGQRGPKGPTGTQEQVISGPAWFKVEPVIWIVLNYDKWKAGEEDLEVMSKDILTVMPFDDEVKDFSGRFWIDEDGAYRGIQDPSFGDFIAKKVPLIREYMFELENLLFGLDIKELEGRNLIELSEVYNSIDTRDGIDDPSNIEHAKDPNNLTEGYNAYKTEDRLYLLSYYEVNTKYRGTSNISGLIAGPSDFAISNGAIVVNEINWLGTPMQLTLPDRVGASAWWLRTTKSTLQLYYWLYEEAIFSNYIFGATGEIETGWDIIDDRPMNYGVRPAMHLNIKP